MAGRTWTTLLLSKNAVLDEFLLVNRELDRIFGGTFSPFDVEIQEIVGRDVRFSVLTVDMHKLTVTVTFAEERSVQIFFREIRSRQRRVMIFLKHASIPPRWELLCIRNFVAGMRKATRNR